MGKNAYVSSLMLGVLLLLAVYVPADAENKGETDAVAITKAIVTQMEATGARATEVELRTTLTADHITSIEELFSFGKELSNQFQTPINTALKQEKGLHVYESQRDDGGARLQFRLVGVSREYAFQAYIVLSIGGKRSHLQDIERLYRIAETSLKQNRMIPQFSTCIRGIYSDTLVVDQQEGKISAVLQSLRANEIERFQDETVTSVSAYTERWTPFITTNEQKMNLQVATHRDIREQLTRITIGSPVITAEY